VVLLLIYIEKVHKKKRLPLITSSYEKQGQMPFIKALSGCLKLPIFMGVLERREGSRARGGWYLDCFLSRSAQVSNWHLPGFSVNLMHDEHLSCAKGALGYYLHMMIAICNGGPAC
jgi:hypothetical protein